MASAWCVQANRRKERQAKNEKHTHFIRIELLFSRLQNNVIQNWCVKLSTGKALIASLGVNHAQSYEELWKN
jgi:hypothetical protein